MSIAIGSPKVGGQMPSIRLKFLAISQIVTAMLLVGCSKAKLGIVEKASYEPSAITAQYCSVDASSIKSYMKFIILLDRSGSNNLATGPGGVIPPSDPNGAKRYPTLIDFVRATGNGPDTFWSYIPIGDSATDNASFMNNDLVGTRGRFENLLNNHYVNTASGDQQETNTLAALTSAQALILKDIEAARRNPTELVSSTYVIFVVTDGFPTLNRQPQDPQQIKNAASGIMQLPQHNRDVVDSVQINTAFYYGNPLNHPLHQTQVDAASLLREVATIGQGRALSFGAGDAIDFSQFTVPNKILKYSNREVWVENTNAVWVGNRLEYDEDGDGLSNQQEVALGSDPLVVDTDRNGLSDGIEYKLSGKPCADSACSVSGGIATAVQCSGLTKDTFGNFLDTNSDGINDCAAILLKSSIKDRDTNGDLVPDALALRRGIPVVGSNNVLSNSDQDKDRVSDYIELQMNTPVYYPNDGVPGLIPLRFKKTVTSSNPTQSCYELNVMDMVTFKPTDKIRVYLVDTTEIITDKRVVRIAEKPIGFGSINFSNSDFR